MSAPARLPAVDEAVFQHIVDTRPPHVTSNDQPHAYASEALNCDRKIALRVLGMPETNPPDGGTHFTFWMGDTIHQLVQDVIAKQYPGSEVEVRWTKDHVSGRADATYPSPRDGKLVVCEIKSMAPYAYDLATGKKKGEEGVKAEHAMQANLSALALGAPYIHVVYVNKAASAGQNPVWESRGLANHAEATVELERLNGIVKDAIAGNLPRRRWAGEIIKDPTSTKWPCGYCNWRDACAGIPDPDPETTEEAPF